MPGQFNDIKGKVPGGAVGDIILSQTLPVDSAVARFRDQYTSTESAVGQPFARPGLPWETSQATVGEQVLDANQSLMIVTKDPLCAIMYENKNPNGLPLAQRWCYGVVNGSPSQSVFVAPGETVEPDIMKSIPQPGNIAFHGPSLYYRHCKGKDYLWCDAGRVASANNRIEIVNFTVAILATDVINVSIYRLNDGDEVKVGTFRLPATATNNIALSVNLPAPDYYRVVYNFDATDSTGAPNLTPFLNLGVQNVATSAIMVHLPLPNIDEEAQKIQQIRVLGAAMRAMNTANADNIAGSYVIDQISGGTVWTSYIRNVGGVDGFTRISAQRGNDIRDLKRSMYCFVKTVEEDDFAYYPVFSRDASGLVNHAEAVDMFDLPYVICILKAGANDNTGAPSRSIQCFWNFNVEFETNSSWTAVRKSEFTSEQWEQAQKVLSSIDQFYYNPSFKDILGTIGKLARLSGPILSMFGPYGKAAGVAVTGVGEGLGMLGYRTKKTARPPEDEGGDPAEDPPHKMARSSGLAAMEVTGGE